MTIPFGHPLVLLLLVLPIVLAVRVWRRSESRLVLPFDFTAARRGRLLGFVVNLAEMLPAALLAVVILILAGPQQIGARKHRRQLTNIEFCVDISSSMTAPFGEGNRYDAAMEAINKFVDYREGDAFGLTFFGNSVMHWVPLTSDVSAIKCAVPFMRPDRAPPWFGGTEIAKAILACRRVLRRARRRRPHDRAGVRWLELRPAWRSCRGNRTAVEREPYRRACRAYRGDHGTARHRDAHGTHRRRSVRR